MSQSLYACASLLDLTYDIQNALVLLVLWVISTAVIEARLLVAILFLGFAAWEALRNRGHNVVFSAVRDTPRKSVFRRTGIRQLRNRACYGNLVSSFSNSTLALY